MQNKIIIIIKEVIVDAFPKSQVRLLMVHTKFSKLTHEARIGNGNPLQYPCLENPMDRGAWWAIVCGGLKELDTTLCVV